MAALVSAACAAPETSRFPLGTLPASFVGDLPGAGGPIRWHLDLLPAMRYQLRLTYLDKPEPNRHDDIGRFAWDDARGRLVLRGGRMAPVVLEPASGGALRKLDLQGRRIVSAHNDLLQRLSVPAPIEPRLPLLGLFATMADAPSITLCADGRRVAVAMEADYRALERAYLAAHAAPGAPLLVQVDGLISPRRTGEVDAAPRPALVVERFGRLIPGGRCETAAPR